MKKSSNYRVTFADILDTIRNATDVVASIISMMTGMTTVCLMSALRSMPEGGPESMIE